MEESRGYHGRINLASTYRNLALFTRLGLVRPLYIGETQPLYTRNDKPHHHAICLHCNEVQEFEECAASGLERLVEEKYGFRSSSHLLEIYGLCKTCQEAPQD